MAVCNQITLLILCYTSSRLITLLKVTDAHIQVSDMFECTVSFKFINFNFQIFLFSVPEVSFRVTTLLCSDPVTTTF